MNDKNEKIEYELFLEVLNKFNPEIRITDSGIYLDCWETNGVEDCFECYFTQFCHKHFHQMSPNLSDNNLKKFKKEYPELLI